MKICISVYIHIYIYIIANCFSIVFPNVSRVMVNTIGTLLYFFPVCGRSASISTMFPSHKKETGF